jgi:hypothetical protein
VEVFRSLPFPFAGDVFPPNLGAVIQRTVLDGQVPALEIVHTADNSWLVGDGVNDPNEPGACVVAGIWHVIDLDPTIADLASLPVGQVASRSAVDAVWAFDVHEWVE